MKSTNGFTNLPTITQSKNSPEVKEATFQFNGLSKQSIANISGGNDNVKTLLDENSNTQSITTMIGIGNNAVNNGTRTIVPHLSTGFNDPKMNRAIFAAAHHSDRKS